MLYPHPRNILVILADQWRPDWLGCAGVGLDLSPNLDALAAGGTRFTRCFTPCPVCVPARISLATGLDPERLGATDNHASLPQSQRTWYQDLRDAGWRTAVIGKLDLDKPDAWNGDGRRPRTYAWGFTDPLEVEGKMHAGRTAHGHGEAPIGPYQRWLAERGLLQIFRDDYRRRSEAGWVAACEDSVLPEAAWADRFVGRRAAEWITTAERDAPWCLSVHFAGPHDPFDPPADAAARFREAAVPATHGSGLPRWMGGHAPDLDPATTTRARRQYAACCHAIDAEVGRILSALRDSGQADDTLILFSADHGEMLGDHGCWQKHLPLDASAGVPLIAAGPGVRAGVVSEALISLHDVGATVRELAGLPAWQAVDASSFARLLHEDGRHREACLIVERGYRALRDERWLFIQGRCGDRALYDLEADPWAERDLAASSAPGLLRGFAQRLRDLRLTGGCRR